MSVPAGRSSEAIKVGEVAVAPGYRTQVDLPIADLSTRVPITMPVHVLNGPRDGPVLFVSAAIHGDEINGVEIIRRIMKLAALRRLRGALIAVSHSECAWLLEPQSIPAGPPRPKPLCSQGHPGAPWPPASPTCSSTTYFQTQLTASIFTPAPCTGRTFRKFASMWTIVRQSAWRALLEPL